MSIAREPGSVMWGGSSPLTASSLSAQQRTPSYRLLASHLLDDSDSSLEKFLRRSPMHSASLLSSPPAAIRMLLALHGQTPQDKPEFEKRTM
ncbi:hypothetical protein NQZ68_004679 [Dissostichus eleginoides]|nr:hypothetical protein NQZ68_004679 [Dissostichus eleginoides]